MWLKKQSLFSLVIVLAAGILGVVRYKICYIPGLQGLFGGMLLGGIIGKLGTNSQEIYSFRRRVRLSLWFGFLFVVVQAILVSSLHMGQGDHIFTWMGEVLDGYNEEYFFSFGSTGALVKTASGKIEGFWWIFMALLDAGLFAFGSITGLMIGLPSREKAKFEYRD